MRVTKRVTNSADCEVTKLRNKTEGKDYEDERNQFVRLAA